jgi:hypothetical protein
MYAILLKLLELELKCYSGPFRVDKRAARLDAADVGSHLAHELFSNYS